MTESTEDLEASQTALTNARREIREKDAALEAARRDRDATVEATRKERDAAIEAERKKAQVGSPETVKMLLQCDTVKLLQSLCSRD